MINELRTLSVEYIHTRETVAPYLELSVLSIMSHTASLENLLSRFGSWEKDWKVNGQRESSASR